MQKTIKPAALTFELTAPSIIDQVEARGYTLNNATEFEKIRQATHRLIFAGVLTKVEARNVWRRLNNQVVANVINLPEVSSGKTM